MNNISEINLKEVKLSSTSLSEIMEIIEDNFMECPDIIKRKSSLKNDKDCYFIYIDGIIDLNLLQRDFIAPILEICPQDLENEKVLLTVPVARMSFIDNIDEVINHIISGGIIFLYDGMTNAIGCRLDKVEKRGIKEPETEKDVRAAHDGFIEDINTNMVILRSRIKDKNLKFKTLELGATTKQKVIIAYIQGIANPKLLEELYNRVKKINIDGMIGIGYIEQFITDNPNSIFPQFLLTERPDKVTAALLEGRLTILMDGTPGSLIVPVTFTAFFQTPDAYNFSWIIGSFLGMIRIIATFIALFFPALYIAFTSFHYYMVPLKLLIPLAQSREGVPFPPLLEALIMELTMELFREASIRLPTYVGSSIGVIGAIIIGQAAVQAGIVSVLMIIVIAVTAIASFATPVDSMGFSLRLYRFITMILASIFGIIGILVSITVLFAHLLSLESLGQPYFQPMLPLKLQDLKDNFIRLPLKYMKKRPNSPQPIDKERGKEGNG